MSDQFSGKQCLTIVYRYLQKHFGVDDVKPCNRSNYDFVLFRRGIRKEKIEKASYYIDNLYSNEKDSL